MDQLYIKTPAEWNEIKKSWTKDETQLFEDADISDIEFRARFRERCHHMLEIQLYEAIAKKKPLRQSQTDTAEMYLRVWDKRGLSHDLPDYKFVQNLVGMARKLQSGEIPELDCWEPQWFNDEDRVVLNRAIYERRSVRHWDWEREVPDEVIDKVLDAGLWASHACNLQSIRYLIIHEKKTPNLFLGGDIPPGPVHLVVCSDSRVYKANPLMPDYNSILDAGAAGQNILLQAHAYGLGGCWVTFTSDNMRVRLREHYDLPDYLNLMFYIDVGYPTQTPCPPFRMGTDEAILVRD